MSHDDSESVPKLSFIQTSFIYFGYTMLIMFGKARDFFAKMFGHQITITPKVCCNFCADYTYRESCTALRHYCYMPVSKNPTVLAVPMLLFSLQHLYKKLGFVEEGRHRDAHFHDRRFWDMISYSMLESEWAAIREVKN